jgi:hypothetical protein
LNQSRCSRSELLVLPPRYLLHHEAILGQPSDLTGIRQNSLATVADRNGVSGCVTFSAGFVVVIETGRIAEPGKSV